MIRSGSHGDEYGVIEVLRLVVGAYESKLPNLVFIPEVSPSAISRKTRLNKRGIDINRSFVDEATDPETLANMEIARNYRFDLCIDFHEDLGTDGYYMYDSGNFERRKLTVLKQNIRSLGIRLFTGIDDPDDPALEIKVVDGYVPNSLEKMGPESGMFEIWAMRRGFLTRCLVPEIPGRLNLTTKKKLVELIFDELVLGQ